MEGQATPNEEESSYLASSYTLYFKKGAPLGLNLGKSSCGQFPVVLDIWPSHMDALAEYLVDDSNIEQIETSLDLKSTRTPRPGAIIVGVDGQMIQKVGVEHIWLQIAALSESEEGSTSSSETERKMDTDGTYSLSFVKLTQDFGEGSKVLMFLRRVSPYPSSMTFTEGICLCSEHSLRH